MWGWASRQARETWILAQQMLPRMECRQGLVWDEAKTSPG